MKKKFCLKSLLSLLLLFIGINAWGDEEEITLSSGSFENSAITWSGTSCTINQAQGSSTTKVSSSYISAPRWYKSHVITFKANSGYTLTGATVVCTSDSYATALKSSTYSTGASATVSSSTVTITTSGDFTITMGDQARPSSIKISYTAANTNAASAPTLTTAGVFTTSSYDVTMTNNESGATVYYTTDGNDPTTSSSSFADGSKTISISETTTVKAMAVVSGKDNSSVASATYTMLTPYTSFTDALKDATSSTKQAAFTFNGQVVTAATTKYAYLLDASGNAAVIYNSSAHGFTQGQTLTGTVICSIQKYNGVLEFTQLTSSTDGITTGTGTPTATTKDLADVSASDYGKLLTIESLVYDGTNSVLKNGDNTITPYTTFCTPEYTNGAKYTVTGIILTNNSTLEISPRTTDDVVKTADPSKSTPKVYFTNDKVQVAYTGGTVPENTLSNNGGKPKYTSSNTSVATVDENSGKVTLNTYGITTITVTTEENDDYFAGTASYKLLYLSGDGSETHPYNAIDLNNVTGVSTNTMVWVSGKILGSSSSSGTGVATTAAAANIALGDDKDYPSLENTITVSIVTALRNVLDLTKDNSVIGKTIKIYGGYNSDYYKRCGINSSAAQKIVGLSDGLSVSSVGYATYYDAAAWVVPVGLIVKYVSAASSGILTWKQYDEGETVPANTGVVVSGVEANYPITYIGSGSAAPTDNLLKGSVTDETTSGGDKYYMLSLDINSTAGSVGFYYGADGGGTFTNSAHKAYLALTEAQAGSAKAFIFNDDDASAINAVESALDINAPVYNLSGQRVSPTTKGILIQNGKKYFNK